MTALRTPRRRTASRTRLVAACTIAVGLAAAASGVAVAVSRGHAPSHAISGNAKSLVVSTKKTTKYGTYLVSGNTLYTLTPSKTACTAKCLKTWPELLVPAGLKGATAGSGVKQSKLGTFKVAGGRLQVTYGGKRLYYFSGDKSPGSIKGLVKDTWGSWFLDVTVKPKSPPPPTTTTTSGGGIGF
jgi:predicted lipoprotein with Yx(FWY)xxD motif